MEGVATPQRRSDPTLIERLLTQPYRFDFFQAVRVLEELAADERRPALGQDGPVNREAVRFAAHLSLAFPASSIDCVRYNGLVLGEEGHGETLPLPPFDHPPRMTITFLGLIGPMGVLPICYTEDLLRPELAKRRGVLLEFLDLFHHRLVSFFYRAWEKYRPVPQWERRHRLMRAGAAPSREPDPLARHFLELIGLGPPPLRHRLSVPDDALLFYVNLFAMEHRSAIGLERLLQHYFGKPIQVVSFVGQWLHLRPDQRSRPGVTGAYHTLGQDVVVGRRAWDDQSKFRVRIGPLSFPTFRDFLPGGRAVQALLELTRLYVRGEFDFEVQLVLRADEVPECQLSRESLGLGQVGRTAWLKRRPFQRDAEDAVFQAAI
jgi:type VI secretion system protein ImpH